VALVGSALLAVILAVTVSGVFAGTVFALLLLAVSAGSAHGLSPGRRRALEIVLAVAVAAAFVGGVLVSVGVNAGVVLVLAAVFAGVVLIWVVRLS
jgi:hypothetical protein